MSSHRKNNTEDFPEYKIASIEDIISFKPEGPWKTKSDGELDVLFRIPFDLIQSKYFFYEKTELDKLPHDIRGFRSYRVSSLKKGAIGANEWHKIRNEIVFVAKGKVLWNLVDAFGKSRELTLSAGESLWIPPYILHTYTSLVSNTELVVLASTLFIPEDPSTHDTFSKEAFTKLKRLSHPS